MTGPKGRIRCRCGAVAHILWDGDWTCTAHIRKASDRGSASLFVACLLAGIVPTVLALLFVAPFLAALSGVVQS